MVVWRVNNVYSLGHVSFIFVGYCPTGKSPWLCCWPMFTYQGMCHSSLLGIAQSENHHGCVANAGEASPLLVRLHLSFCNMQQFILNTISYPLLIRLPGFFFVLLLFINLSFHHPNLQRFNYLHCICKCDNVVRLFTSFTICYVKQFSKLSYMFFKNIFASFTPGKQPYFEISEMTTPQ